MGLGAAAASSSIIRWPGVAGVVARPPRGVVKEDGDGCSGQIWSSVTDLGPLVAAASGGGTGVGHPSSMVAVGLERMVLLVPSRISEVLGGWSRGAGVRWGTWTPGRRPRKAVRQIGFSAGVLAAVMVASFGRVGGRGCSTR